MGSRYLVYGIWCMHTYMDDVQGTHVEVDHFVSFNFTTYSLQYSILNSTLIMLMT